MIAVFVRIKSWQWTLIGLLVSGAGALSVGMWGEPLLSASYGESVNGKRQFEDALTRREGSRPWFTDLSVHAEQVGEGGEKRTVHVVSGMYYDGRAGGSGKPEWSRAFYVAEVPYHPVTNLSRLPGGGEATKRFESLAEPTVLDFLGAMRRARGVQFTHAWWRSPDNARLAWLFVGALGVGIGWPLTLNLIVYGAIRRPRELALESTVPAPATTQPPAVDDGKQAAAMAQLDHVLDDLLQSGQPDAPTSPLMAAAAAPTPIRPLVTRPLETVPPAQGPTQKAFGAAKEDYYPTEIKAPKAKPANSRPVG